ncbi:MAG: DUF305 domain-containing protein [Gemmatirosa sp.]
MSGMNGSSWQMVAVALVAAAASAGCRSAAPPATAGSPAPATPAPTAATAPADDARMRRAADATFMRTMIGHHAQALAMTALVPARSRRDDLRLLAQRIETTQRDEIALMQRWLRTRGEPVPGADPQHAHHGDAPHAAMPGMLTPAELTRLAEASGAAFDRLFLEYMIRHHEGALTMVADYFRTPGAGQDTEAFRLASDVDADQRAEIRRMRATLDAAPPAPR